MQDDKSERCVTYVKRQKRNVQWRRHMLSLQGKAGAMQDKRTKRNRTRTVQRDKAIRESREG
jgi:hypothetical protein